ncbi:ATP-binding protein [Vampirovibrio chlorellavorus]|uniref:ATP-binding protein n=1 Tax=Vampirovibrio chlorellavorus TaxID=758823 RepID=UPI0026EE680B|nr:ATP-binding protein [Vampirovibrio chlorellavorus]
MAESFPLDAFALDDLGALPLLESLTSGAMVCDAAGQVLYVNPVLRQLLGSPSLPTVTRLNDWIQPLPKVDCAFCLGLPDGEPTPLHSGFLRSAAQPAQPEALKVKIKHSPLDHGSVLTLIDPFSEDTTLTQAHSDFVSTVSHEFRTPLTSIKGFADTLLRYGGQLPDEEKRRFISIIKDQADRLIRLVENLLAASRLSAGRVELSYRPIPLKKLLEKTVESVRAKIMAQQSTVPPRMFHLSVHPESIEVWADVDKLEQVFINLLDNAAKYSPEGTLVTVRAEFLPEDDTQVRIVVQDQGPGIPAELLPKIFTQFYRVESPLKQQVEGTGLGLYITQSLTTAMGGRISAESTPGQGSSFTVIFPAATPERQAMYQRRLSASEVER